MDVFFKEVAVSMAFLLELFSALALSISNGADTLSGAETMKESDEGWVDFKAIKESVDVRRVLSHFGLLEHLEARGAELVGWCPLGEEHGKKDSFSMNMEHQVSMKIDNTRVQNLTHLQ